MNATKTLRIPEPNAITGAREASMGLYSSPAFRKRTDVVQTLQLVENHNFFKDQLVKEAAVARRALIIATNRGIAGEIMDRRLQIEDLVSLDKSLLIVRQGRESGLATKVFGRLDKRMENELLHRRPAYFKSDRWDWKITTIDKGGIRIPRAAIFSLGVLESKGVAFDRLFVGKAVSNSFWQTMKAELKKFGRQTADVTTTTMLAVVEIGKSALESLTTAPAMLDLSYNPTPHSDPVLLGAIERSHYLIEICRWE